MVILIVVFLALQYRLWVGEGSLAHVYELKREIKKQQAENQRLKTRNQMLAREVDALKNNLDSVEAMARAELGLIKEGETLIKVIEKD